MRRVYLKIAILTLIVLTSFATPLLLDGAADLIHSDAPSSRDTPIAVASPITVQSSTTSPSTDATIEASASSIGSPDSETVEFTTQDAQDYVARNSPFISDPSQPPPTITIEFLSRAEVEAQLNVPVTVSNDVPLCLVTLRGHFIDNESPASPQPSTFAYLLFDAHTGMMFLAGSTQD
ncbi:MAG TPA: hypothetical protein VHV31_06820 [Nitrolancea sp.]|jgi:hypothetical protein|nr:hypothetical protein [Nitrolancea sp.]